MKINELQIKQHYGSVKTPAVQKTQRGKRAGKLAQTSDKSIPKFDEVLKGELNQNSPLKFSAHAAKRINDRQMDMDPMRLQRLEDGVTRANEKGATNSLIMMDDSAYIVSIKNRTVITAMPQNNVQGNVFTNIDSVTFV